MDGVGVPQGGILSPLLSNVILHELDLFVTNLVNEKKSLVKNVPQAGKCKEYGNLTSRIYRARIALSALRESRDSPSKVKEKSRSLRKLVKERRRFPTVEQNSESIRLE